MSILDNRFGVLKQQRAYKLVGRLIGTPCVHAVGAQPCGAAQLGLRCLRDLPLDGAGDEGGAPAQ